MWGLTVFRRFGLLLAAFAAVLLGVTAMNVALTRQAIYGERRAKVQNLVQAAQELIGTFDAKGQEGEFSPEKAHQLAFEALQAMRWGKGADYFGVYGAGSANAGITYVHAKAAFINTARWNYRDGHGQPVVQNIVKLARNGGGFLEYLEPRPSGGAEAPKLVYVGAYGSGEGSLAIQAGVYTDDIDAEVVRKAAWSACGGMAGILIAAMVAIGLGRGLTRPLRIVLP